MLADPTNEALLLLCQLGDGEVEPIEAADDIIMEVDDLPAPVDEQEPELAAPPSLTPAAFDHAELEPFAVEEIPAVEEAVTSVGSTSSSTGVAMDVDDNAPPTPAPPADDILDTSAVDMDVDSSTPAAVDFPSLTKSLRKYCYHQHYNPQDCWLMM